MDFITDLLLREGCDKLWVIIDRFNKMGHFIPLKKKNKQVEDLAEVFTQEISQLHGIPANIISDRDSRLTSQFWNSFLTTVGIRPQISTAFHTQTDDQTR
jgi:hypothetical protein